MLPGRDTKIGRVFSRLTDLPSLPKVVEKLLHLTDKASTRDFADLIATDQGLSAKVLRLVNSAFYSLRSPISSIRHASSLLGVRTLKSLALSVSVIQIFKRQLPGFDPVRFWRHALAVALAGQKTSERLGLAVADETYIVGLLHDIGIALMVQHYPDDYSRLATPGLEGSGDALVREDAEFGMSHPEIGFNLATHWRLPALVGVGIRHHHTPRADLPADLDPDARRLIDVVRFADCWARRNGHSFADYDGMDPNLPSEEFEAVGLPPEELGSLLGDLGGAIQELENLFFEGRAEPAKTK
jgi:HD-like signal output (HDOD) protein